MNKIEIIQKMLIKASILTVEQVNDPTIQKIIKDSQNMISFDIEEGEDWQVGMQPTTENSHGFIYMSWKQQQLADLIHAIHVWKMLNDYGAEPAP